MGAVLETFFVSSACEVVQEYRPLPLAKICKAQGSGSYALGGEGRRGEGRGGEGRGGGGGGEERTDGVGICIKFLVQDVDNLGMREYVQTV